jgi:chromosome segregation ATPase
MRCLKVSGLCVVTAICALMAAAPTAFAQVPDAHAKAADASSRIECSDEEAVAAAIAAIEEKRAEVAADEEDIAKDNEAIDVLEGELGAVRTAANGAQEAIITSHNKEIEAKEMEIGVLEGEIASLREALEAREAGHEKNIEQIEQKILVVLAILEEPGKTKEQDEPARIELGKLRGEIARQQLLIKLEKAKFREEIEPLLRQIGLLRKQISSAIVQRERDVNNLLREQLPAEEAPIVKTIMGLRRQTKALNIALKAIVKEEIEPLVKAVARCS